MVQFYEQISKQNITNIVTLQQIFSDKYSVPLSFLRPLTDMEDIGEWYSKVMTPN